MPPWNSGGRDVCFTWFLPTIGICLGVHQAWSRSILCLHLPRHFGSIWHSWLNQFLKQLPHAPPMTLNLPRSLGTTPATLSWWPLLAHLPSFHLLKGLFFSPPATHSLVISSGLVALNRIYTLMILKLNFHPELCSELQTNIFNHQLNSFTWIPDVKQKRPEL